MGPEYLDETKKGPVSLVLEKKWKKERERMVYYRPKLNGYSPTNGKRRKER